LLSDRWNVTFVIALTLTVYITFVYAGGILRVEATMRKQRRRNAILPLKVMVIKGGAVHLAHTLDISASGVRLVVATQFAPGTQVFVEFKRRRAAGTVIWSKARKDSKYDHELGVQMRNAGSAFWGINLPLREADEGEGASIPFGELMKQLAKRA
jgi:hypothetical protein